MIVLAKGPKQPVIQKEKKYFVWLIYNQSVFFGGQISYSK